MQGWLSTAQELAVQYGLRILAAVVVLIVGRWVARGVRRVVERLMERGRLDPTIIKFAGNLTYIALLAFTILAALNQLGIQTTSFIAVLGAAGLAIGLALQGSLSNFAAGFLMILFRPFRVGDYIEAAGTAGTVEEIQIFTTTLRTPDNKVVIVPNAKLTADNIVNWSAKGTRRVDMVFGIGPAGTGKTYLAMAMAIASLTKGLVNRIILTRPAVEAGEALGFLPGDLAEKVDPYLRPLYDALHDMVRFERASSLIQQGVIEVAPLAFMRGRTLNDAFVILDEAQNTTGEQMKMFLTRIGFNSKAVITGDITQTDLPEGKVSGLVQSIEILKPIDSIRFIYFSKQDVVRHRLVQAIIQAYEDHDRRLRQTRDASA